MRLWDKGIDPDAMVAEFTAGNDPEIDLEILQFDCQASAAHARMLKSLNIFDQVELDGIITELDAIRKEALAGTVTIPPEMEDCHTYVEDRLTRVLGEPGRKIHTARSRNDQVLTAVRLYEKDRLEKIRESLSILSRSLESFSRKHSDIPMPGYTHTRRAMPYSAGLWAGCFLEALADDLTIVASVAALIDRSPLGTGAGYGVPMEIDREMTARELGFAGLLENSSYAQLTRGKYEAAVLHALFQVMLDLNRMASDIILFSSAEFGFFILPEKLCTGSSIMPQKKNPDLLELVRARLHLISSCEIQVRGLISNLTSGYHRDIQLSKEPVIRAFRITLDCLAVMTKIFTEMSVDREACQKALTPEVFATARAYELVRQGIPFREAYRRVAAELNAAAKDS
ncbi:MAG: argininosuccinate lyase [Candidatus Wallbacteria bacterium]|nr:argininosuccinate lyase [Candidatus Wallbacteria bacterium]